MRIRIRKYEAAKSLVNEVQMVNLQQKRNLFLDPC